MIFVWDNGEDWGDNTLEFIESEFAPELVELLITSVHGGSIKATIQDMEWKYGGPQPLGLFVRPWDVLVPAEAFPNRTVFLIDKYDVYGHKEPETKPRVVRPEWDELPGYFQEHMFKQWRTLFTTSARYHPYEVESCLTPIALYNNPVENRPAEEGQKTVYQRLLEEE